MFLAFSNSIDNGGGSFRKTPFRSVRIDIVVLLCYADLCCIIVNMISWWSIVIMAGQKKLYKVKLRSVFFFVFIFQSLNFLLQQFYFTLLGFIFVFKAFPNLFVGTDILYNIVNIILVFNIVNIKCNIIIITTSRIQFGVPESLDWCWLNLNQYH